MKENKKAILEILKKKSKKDGKFESLVLNLALQKIDSDSFEFYGDAVYTADKKRLVYCMSQAESFHIPEGVTTIGEMAFRGKKQLKNIIIANSVKEIEHDDCDLLHDIIVPAGTSKTFRKALHFTDGDTDFLVLEKPADNATVAPSAPQQEQKKGNKKQDAPKDKKQDKADKKQDKKAADKADKKQDKKAADKQEQKQEQK